MVLDTLYPKGLIAPLKCPALGESEAKSQNPLKRFFYELITFLFLNFLQKFLRIIV